MSGRTGRGAVSLQWLNERQLTQVSDEIILGGCGGRCHAPWRWRGARGLIFGALGRVLGAQAGEDTGMLVAFSKRPEDDGVNPTQLELGPEGFDVVVRAIVIRAGDVKFFRAAMVGVAPVGKLAISGAVDICVVWWLTAVVCGRPVDTKCFDVEDLLHQLHTITVRVGWEVEGEDVRDYCVFSGVEI